MSIFHYRNLLITFIAMLLLGCVSTVEPYSSDEDVVPQTDGDERLWHASQEFDDVLKKSGNLVGNDAADQYLQSVLDKLFPDRAGYLRIRILKSPDLNAMALPNGSIYINAGLLAAMQNEAQLATVLAHEGVHVLQKHSAEGRERAKQAAGWAMTLGMGVALIGIPPSIINAGIYSSIAGHSRENEQESDNLGYERLVEANYDVREASKVFEQMLIEVEATDIKQPYFFASHPKLKDRITNFNNLSIFIDKRVSRRIGTDRFSEMLSTVRIDALREKLAAGRYSALAALLEQDSYRKSFGAEGHFFLAESYRFRAKEGDENLARQAYDDSIAQGYLDAEVYKGAGFLAYKQSRYSDAKNFFKTYLEKASDDDGERGFVEFYMKKMNERH